MRLGRGFTAARRQASRLACLVRLPAAWPIQTAIRRQASWLAQGAVPLDPTPRQRARGCSEDMQLGRGVTAARRQASRLAGLVRLPAVWPIQTAIRRQASWLAAKASMDLKSRWPFALKKYTTHAESSHPARAAYAPTNYESEFPPAYQRCKNSQATTKHPNPQGVSMPHADCAGAERR